jgi:hypothetical protein
LYRIGVQASENYIDDNSEFETVDEEAEELLTE